MKEFPEKGLDFSDLFLPAAREARGALKMAACLEEGGEIIGKATFWGHPSEEDTETGQGERLAISYDYGVHGVEVAVDTETGMVKVLQILLGLRYGKSDQSQDV